MQMGSLLPCALILLELNWIWTTVRRFIMLLSMQTDYAVRVLLDIASNWQGQGVITRTLAERLHVPRVFLTKIVAQLAGYGYLRTQRGKGGGIMLSRSPEQINLLEVIEVFEGRIRSTSCTVSDDFCCLFKGCAIRGLWSGAENSLRNYLGGFTLADLVESASRQGENNIPDTNGSAGENHPAQIVPLPH
jgi:Rrf2 family protein